MIILFLCLFSALSGRLAARMTSRGWEAPLAGGPLLLFGVLSHHLKTTAAVAVFLAHVSRTLRKHPEKRVSLYAAIIRSGAPGMSRRGGKSFFLVKQGRMCRALRGISVFFLPSWVLGYTLNLISFSAAADFCVLLCGSCNGHRVPPFAQCAEMQTRR